MGLFSRRRNPIPPYDKLEAEQRYALYYLLEYLTMKGVPLTQMSWALQYLEKAAVYFGMTKKQIPGGKHRIFHWQIQSRLP